LRSISVYRHAVVNTPVARWILIARGTAYSNRFPVSSGGGLPQTRAGSATTLDFSRPAQRSLAVTACRLAASPKATHLSRRLRRFRYLHRRSDSYRLERPSCRARLSLAEDQHLTRFTAHVESRCGAVVLGLAYLLPALSVTGASLASPCSVSTSRSSNRAGGFPAPGFRTRLYSYSASHVRPRTVAATSLEAGTIPTSGTDIDPGTVLFLDPVP
jgi:hypothetical protein